MDIGLIGEFSLWAGTECRLVFLADSDTVFIQLVIAIGHCFLLLEIAN